MRKRESLLNEREKKEEKDMNYTDRYNHDKQYIHINKKINEIDNLFLI